MFSDLNLLIIIIYNFTVISRDQKFVLVMKNAEDTAKTQRTVCIFCLHVLPDVGRCARPLPFPRTTISGRKVLPRHLPKVWQWMQHFIGFMRRIVPLFPSFLSPRSLPFASATPFILAVSFLSAATSIFPTKKRLAPSSTSVSLRLQPANVESLSRRPRISPLSSLTNRPFFYRLRRRRHPPKMVPYLQVCVDDIDIVLFLTLFFCVVLDQFDLLFFNA